ncbi:isoleucine--tRNA ligase [Patescibacteria group bacterium AH-259-L07]|nr:isoleucine--tRNA ligase [Patescibacteria group bacterium AH-259-L07]
MDFSTIEHNILKFWEKHKIFQKLQTKNQGNKRWSFLDGPITANNPMGVHHAWGRTYKDLFCRYMAMRGFDQRYQNGFDCQGLWVEVEVEKEKGFKTKKDIETFGIEKFVTACKDRVKKYSEIQTKQSIRLGQWMDWENSYFTMSDENNYAIWSFLKKCHQKQLLYKGKDVVPWCVRCGTAISQHEILAEEYQELTHKSIFLKFPIVGQKNTYFLVWTTTPWTLPANVALAVHPDFTYAKVQDAKGDMYIVVKSKADVINKGKIIKTFLGEDLEGLNYQGIFDELDALRDAMGEEKHVVILWDEVTEEEGTGIVHIAPGCGQEDFQLSRDEDLPVIDPTDEESKYPSGFGILTGKLVTEVNNLIFNNLEKKGVVFKIEDYTHRYPTCWRCKSELIFRLVDEWYISMNNLRTPLMKVCKKIQWLPSYGLDRELDWLKNMRDWLISKKRYWGLALPIYECQRCHTFEVVGSKQELQERALYGWKEFKGHSPHRPWVDTVKIQCSKCDEVLLRIVDVGNPWLDAGIVSFSTIKYFEDKKYWRQWFPADFVCESFPGQFRNWFYSLIVMSTVLENKEPMKTIFGYALVRDEYGEEMHKSKSNVIWFDEAVKMCGADVLRWIYSSQNPYYNLRFGWNTVKQGRNKLLTLWNSFLFFKTYADKHTLDKTFSGKASHILDQWIISRLHHVIDEVTNSLDAHDPMTAALSIEQFFVVDLSRWYIRRSRDRFSHIEAMNTLYYVLLHLIKLAAPFIPFLTEEIYSFLKTDTMEESVHLNDWPTSDNTLQQIKLEQTMKHVRDICEIGHSLRAQAQIKVRQPLQELAIAGPQLSDEFVSLIKDELNIENIRWVKKLPSGDTWVVNKDTEVKVGLDTHITPELKKQGLAREMVRHINALRKKAGLTKNDTVMVYYQTKSKELISVIEEYKQEIMNKTVSKDMIDKPAPSSLVQDEVNIEKSVLVLSLGK